MGRGGEGSEGSHGGGGGHFNYGSSRGGGHSRGGGRSSSNYNPVYRTSYYRPMTPLGGTLSIVLAIIVIVAVVILLVGVTGGICRVLWRHRRQKRTQEILNTPPEELAVTVLKKYGEEGDE